ncbi:protein kinase domain-containing protein [Pendulispora albinea]|uniref:Protein kinase n=1 Tax=Pendulispora albinea TaxID=2741071 RepID=A0ABZ2MC04_9BACT
MGVRNRVDSFEASASSGDRPGGPYEGDPLASTITGGARNVSADKVTAKAGLDGTLVSAVANTVEVHRDPGQRLGGPAGTRFEVIERLGGGGMSVVFLARDTVLDRTVAIKFLTTGGLDTAEALERIQLEARACARLSHENIVRIFDMGADKGVPFLVMEHLEGRSLDAIVKEERVDAQRAVRILTDVARGLCQAHRLGIVHRDLKPSNVFVTRDGTAKILDFGVASIADKPGAPGDGFSGTPGYMAPEQWRGQAQDGRTDLWAVGIMLFELLGGIPPFPMDTLMALRDAVTSPERAPSLRAVRPDLPEEASVIAQRALEKSPGARYGTAEELLDGLVALEVVLSRAMRKNRERGERAGRTKPDRRPVTVVTCALHGASELPGESGLDEIGETLDEFFEICTTVVRQLEGALLSSIGPRIVACFGYPKAHEDNAHRALRAASLIVDAIRGCTSEGGQPMAARVGVATSLAIAERIEREGSPPNIRGDAPHLAQWLERRAGPNEILISEVTQTLVRSVFHLEALGEAVPDGGVQPVRIHRVLRSKEAPSRFDAITRGELTPMVGRDQELEELAALWEEVKAGHGRFAWIVGEAGIGKSRLLEHHLERAAADERRVVHGQCWPYFQNSALQPVAEGLLHAMGLRTETPAHEKIRLLEAALAEIDRAVTRQTALLAAALGIPTGDRYPSPSLSPDLLKKETLETLVDLFVHLAKRQPTVLVVEDAHWSDASTLELLDLLLNAMTDARLMILVTARPDFHSPWPQRAHLRRLPLGRLSAEHTATMIAFASKGRTLPARVVAQLVQRTDGVPLFIEELTHRVADAMDQADSTDILRALDSYGSGAIPATLEALLHARLDALPQEGRDVARLIAVLGRDVSYDRIAATWEHTEGLLRVGLMQLVESDVLRRSDRTVEARYTFKHALVKDAAYQSLTRGRRGELHRRAAEVLSERFPGVVEQNPELVAAHFMEAGCHENAVVYFERAGERALARSANDDAATHFRHAIDQLRRLPENEARDPRELALQLGLGRALLAANWSNEIRQVYERVRELGRHAGGYDAQPFSSLLGLWRFYSLAGDIASSGELAHHLMAHPETSKDSGAKFLAHAAIGMPSMLAGDFVTCRNHQRAALALYDETEHSGLTLMVGVDPCVDSGLCLGFTYWTLGALDESVQCVQNTVEHARRKNHPFSLSLALLHAGFMHNFRGEPEGSLARANEATRLATEHGLDAALALAKVVRGWRRAGLGEPGAVQELQEGVTEQIESGLVTAITLCFAPLIWARWKEGDLDGATRALDQAMTFVDKGERIAAVELFRLRGELLHAKGANPTVVCDCFERGLDLARAQRARSWELRLSLSYARLLVSLERTPEAKQLLSSILAQFTEGLGTQDVREARAFREMLGV